MTAIKLRGAEQHLVTDADMARLIDAVTEARKNDKMVSVYDVRAMRRCALFAEEVVMITETDG